MVRVVVIETNQYSDSFLDNNVQENYIHNKKFKDLEHNYVLTTISINLCKYCRYKINSINVNINDKTNKSYQNTDIK